MLKEEISDDRIARIWFKHFPGGKNKSPSTSVFIVLEDKERNELLFRIVQIVRKKKSDSNNLAYARYYAFKKAMVWLRKYSPVNKEDRKKLWKRVLSEVRLPFKPDLTK